MMKKFLVLFIVCIILILTGCSSFNVEVTTPENDTMISGQWKAVECVNLDGESIKDFKDLNSVVSFSKKEAIIFDKIYRAISYKAKRVNSNEYIYSILGYIPEYFKEDSEIIVITISSGNTYIKDFIILNDKCILLDGENIIILNKINDEPLSGSGQVHTEEKYDEYGKMKSGVLLGMKSREESNWVYRTLWIYNDENEIKYEEIPYILLPRKDGFFKVENNAEINKVTISYLNESSKEELKQGVKTENLSDNTSIEGEDITFIGNDYVSLRMINDEVEGENQKLGTYLIDLKTEDKKIPVTLGSVLGNNNLSTKYNNKIPNEMYDVTNFAITRNRGRWCFYSFIEDNIEMYNLQEELFNEYGNKKEISARVSKEIARHDELYTTWQGITNQVASATDALSSPNDNMAIIRTKGKLYVHKVIEDKMDMSSEIIIPIKAKEEIVMAEWALGQYVDNWTEEVNSILMGN